MDVALVCRYSYDSLSNCQLLIDRRYLPVAGGKLLAFLRTRFTCIALMQTQPIRQLPFDRHY